MDSLIYIPGKVGCTQALRGRAWAGMARGGVGLHSGYVCRRGELIVWRDQVLGTKILSETVTTGQLL